MGGFNNPVVGGGGDLVREAIRSPNYESGSAGWTVNQDGSAEFNDVRVRGSLDVGTENAYVKVDIAPPSSPSPGPVIALNSDASAYPTDGFIHGSNFGGGSITLSSPYDPNSSDSPASLDLVSGDPGLDPITGRAARIGGGLYVNGELLVEPTAGNPALTADSTGANVTGNLGVSGLLTAGNVQTGDLNASGMVTAGILTAANIVTGTESVSFSTATSEIRSVSFSPAMPVAAKIVLAVISSGAGVTTGWTIRTDSYTDHSFRLLLAGPSVTWTNVAVNWLAIG